MPTSGAMSVAFGVSPHPVLSLMNDPRVQVPLCFRDELDFVELTAFDPGEHAPRG